MHDVELIRQKYEALKPFLDERVRRLWAGTEARGLGRGGIAAVAAATGLSRDTIRGGMQPAQGGEGKALAALAGARLRRVGGGRKRLVDKDVTLLRDLEALVDPVTRGDPQSPLRWTSKSTRKLAEELQARGHPIEARTVAGLLTELGYSLQALRKTREGAAHPDRDAQFVYINEQTQAFQAQGYPVVSVDAKKKELVGELKTGGREWQPQGEPERVRVYDFVDKARGKAIPYGVYDVTANTGWVSVGLDHDTAEFAVATLRRWWQQMGTEAYPRATSLLVIADGGGSNGARTRLWKAELQRFADETRLHITVCHLPPGTSKWNKIEHRMFAYITLNWRGRPLISHEVIVNLIADTRTTKGLSIRAALDPKRYVTGKKVTDEEMAGLRIERAAFHGDWNYTINPRARTK
jgi:Rhodopirellula transposase DDE domain